MTQIQTSAMKESQPYHNDSDNLKQEYKKSNCCITNSTLLGIVYVNFLILILDSFFDFSALLDKYIVIQNVRNALNVLISFSQISVLSISVYLFFGQIKF
jgi:hypothetical protein